MWLGAHLVGIIIVKSLSDAGYAFSSLTLNDLESKKADLELVGFGIYFSALWGNTLMAEDSQRRWGAPSGGRKQTPPPHIGSTFHRCRFFGALSAWRVLWMEKLSACLLYIFQVMAK
jgi:hypothetical protein